MVSKLTDKIALVTGGSSGLGLATAQRFADEGARVFITGRRKDEIEQAARSIGRGAVGVQGDISRLDDLDRLFGMIKEQAGRLDVLFANAGGGEFAPLGQITEALASVRTFTASSRVQERRGQRVLPAQSPLAGAVAR